MRSPAFAEQQAQFQAMSESSALQYEYPLFQPIIVGLVLDMADAEVVALDDRKYIDQRTALGFGRVIFQFADRYL